MGFRPREKAKSNQFYATKRLFPEPLSLLRRWTRALHLGVTASTAVEKGKRENAMSWTTPTLVEICVGLEINGYLPAEF